MIKMPPYLPRQNPTHVGAGNAVFIGQFLLKDTAFSVGKGPMSMLLTTQRSANRMAIRAYHFALGYLRQQLFIAGVISHRRDVPDFDRSRKVIELQRNRICSISTIRTAAINFDLVDERTPSLVGSLSPSKEGAIAVPKTSALKTCAITIATQALASAVPIMGTLAKLPEVMSRWVEGGYTFHCSPLQMVGRAEGSWQAAPRLCYSPIIPQFRGNWGVEGDVS